MATTNDQMRTLFREFEGTSDTVIGSALLEAGMQVSSEIFGDAYDHAVRLKAAHIIAMTPGGEALRLKPSADPHGHGTIYGKRFAELTSAQFLTPVVV